jgi:ABC-type multidrug transport system permease subunit
MTSARPWSAPGLAWRQILRMRKSPPLALPPIIFPVLLFTAFAGGLSALGATPRFGYPDYTTFQFVWVVLVGASMSGMQSGLALAQDFESGFARRMLLATSRRLPLVTGYVMAGVARTVLLLLIIFPLGVAVGMEVSGTPLQVAAYIVLVLAFAAAVSLWSVGVALRIRSTAAAPLLQTPVLVALFLVPVYSPRALLAGWVKPAADVNPLTAIVEAGRGLMVDQPVSVGLAFAVALGALALLFLFAVTGLRRAEAAG